MFQKLNNQQSEFKKIEYLEGLIHTGGPDKQNVKNDENSTKIQTSKFKILE